MIRQNLNTIDIPITLEDDALAPSYNSTEAAGADVKAKIEHDLILLPNSSILIPTGIRMEIPIGYEVQVRPRSGLALKHQVTVLNTPGTIDSDYRGELQVILINHGKEPFVITPGMRIAQLIVAPAYQARWIVTSQLNHSHRGEKGFGHTGTH